MCNNIYHGWVCARALGIGTFLSLYNVKVGFGYNLVKFERFLPTYAFEMINPPLKSFRQNLMVTLKFALVPSEDLFLSNLPFFNTMPTC